MLALICEDGLTRKVDSRCVWDRIQNSPHPYVEVKFCEDADPFVLGPFLGSLEFENKVLKRVISYSQRFSEIFPPVCLEPRSFTEEEFNQKIEALFSKGKTLSSLERLETILQLSVEAKTDLPYEDAAMALQELRRVLGGQHASKVDSKS